MQCRDNNLHSQRFSISWALKCGPYMFYKELHVDVSFVLNSHLHHRNKNYHYCNTCTKHIGIFFTLSPFSLSSRWTVFSYKAGWSYASQTKTKQNHFYARTVGYTGAGIRTHPLPRSEHQGKPCITDKPFWSSSSGHYSRFSWNVDNT